MSAHLDVTKFETRLFINGEFVNSASGKTFPTINPVTEEVICEVQEADAADVDKAVAAAKEAFKDDAKWRTMDASARRDLMLKLADLMERDVEFLRDLETLDNGKPTGAAGQGYGSAVDLSLSIKCMRYYAGHADKIVGEQVPMDGPYFNILVKEPVGVVGQIIPWNFPLLMACWKLGPALAVGCTVILKSSEKTPLTALHLARLIQEAGFPPGVVNILSGYGPTAGEAMVKHPDVHKIAFTGSTKVGRLIQSMAGKYLKRVTLELGGKSPMIVMDDADIEQAAQAAHVGIFLNQGQCCIASSRVFVQEAIYDKFLARAVELAKSLKAGDPFDGTTTHGPQVDDIQFKSVMSFIEQGKKDGNVAVGGNRIGTKGYFVEPTILTDMSDDAKCSKEEIFGPVLSLYKFKTMEEAIERANDTNYGLGAGVCTRDVGQVLKISKSLRAGTIWVNCYDVFDCASAFGGFGDSGIGRELGSAALNNYIELKSICIALDR